MNSVELAPGTRFAARFEILSVLADGIRGTTYVANDTQRGETLALLVGRSMLSERQHRGYDAIKEALLILREPGIAPLLATGIVDYRPWFAWPLMNGVAVEDVLRTHGTFPRRRAAALVSRVAKALAVPHAQGLFHRNLKPSNLLLVGGSTSDEVVVLDLGIGAVMCSDGRSIATPHFCAPEESDGSAVDQRADIYALGLVLFAMLTGRFAFDEIGPALVEAHRTKPPPRLRAGKSDAEPLEAVVNRALAKRPADRWQTATEFARAIDEVLAAPDVALVVDSSDPMEPAAPAASVKTWHVVGSTDARTLASQPLANAPQLEAVAPMSKPTPEPRERVTPAESPRLPEGAPRRDWWFLVVLVAVATLLGIGIGLWWAGR